MMSQRLFSLRIAGLTSGLLMTLSAVAMAQRPAGAGAPPSHPQPAPQAAPQAGKGAANRPATPTAKGEVKSFTGVAKQLGTTPQALDDAYKAALATNPKLTRGQFIAANMLAKNLGTDHPGVTTQALLDGLAGGKSIGQTLQGLGLSADQAKDAETEANREARGQSTSKSKKPSGTS
jgi:hypothetical protein